MYNCVNYFYSNAILSKMLLLCTLIEFSRLMHKIIADFLTVYMYKPHHRKRGRAQSEWLYTSCLWDGIRPRFLLAGSQSAYCAGGQPLIKGTVSAKRGTLQATLQNLIFFHTKSSRIQSFLISFKNNLIIEIFGKKLRSTMVWRFVDILGWILDKVTML
jgi:hypothetical protein